MKAKNSVVEENSVRSFLGAASIRMTFCPFWFLIVLMNTTGGRASPSRKNASSPSWWTSIRWIRRLRLFSPAATMTWENTSLPRTIAMGLSLMIAASPNTLVQCGWVNTEDSTTVKSALYSQLKRREWKTRNPRTPRWLSKTARCFSSRSFASNASHYWLQSPSREMGCRFCLRNSMLRIPLQRQSKRWRRSRLQLKSFVSRFRIFDTGILTGRQRNCDCVHVYFDALTYYWSEFSAVLVPKTPSARSRRTFDVSSVSDGNDAEASRIVVSASGSGQYGGGLIDSISSLGGHRAFKLFSYCSWVIG